MTSFGEKKSHFLNKNRPKDVIGFGALNVDLIYQVKSPQLLGEEEQKFRPGREIYGSYQEFETSLALFNRVGEKVWQSGGGQAANTIYALAKMGFEVGFVGKVGRDKFGQFLIESLEGIDVSRVRKDKFSGVCLVLLDEKGERSNLVFPNANDFLTFNEIDLFYLEKTEFLHLSSFVGEISFRTQKSVAEILSSKVKISFDLGELYARKGIKALKPLIERSYIFFATDQEISILTGRNYLEGAKEILSLGPEIVVCKKGEEGSHIFSQSENFLMPSESVEVVDKTGAGDVYAAGFLAGLLLKKSLHDCAFLATKAAALSISGYGRENYPDHNFLEIVLAQIEANKS